MTRSKKTEKSFSKKEEGYKRPLETDGGTVIAPFRRREREAIGLDESETFRRPRKSGDDLLPVRNMRDWGCDGDCIMAPRYADRAYMLCSMVDTEDYNKIRGIVGNILPPRMLGKQKFEKPANLSQDQVSAASGYLDKGQLTKGVKKRP